MHTGHGLWGATMDLMAKVGYSYLHKVDLYVPFNGQGKAFDTLAAELGIGVPPRWLDLPGECLRMGANCKHGSWTTYDSNSVGAGGGRLGGARTSCGSMQEYNPAQDKS